MKQPGADQELMTIGAVVELLRQDFPDISHSSLRFLEREGLVTPTRTAGGHRLFSAESLQRIRQIKEWQSQRLTLEEIRRRLDERDAVGAPEELSSTFLEQALAGDLEAAQRTILTAHDIGLPLDFLLNAVLRPALWELGHRWERGEVSVAQEKEVSHAARDVIAELVIRSSGDPDSESGDIVAACVEGERHELGLLMVSGLLRARGVGVHFLGVDVAPVFLVDAVKRRRPQAVLLSATSDERLPDLQAAVAALRDAGAELPILAGGQAVERHPALVSSWGVTPLIHDDLDHLDSLARGLTSPSM